MCPQSMRRQLTPTRAQAANMWRLADGLVGVAPTARDARARPALRRLFAGWHRLSWVTTGPGALLRQRRYREAACDLNIGAIGITS